MTAKIFNFNPEFYLKKDALALEINDRSATILSFEKKREEYFPKTWGNWTLPPGIIEKGRIKNRKTFLLVLKNLLNKTWGKFPLHHPVIMSIPEEAFFSRVTHIAQDPLKTEQPEKIIEKEIEDHFPMYPSEVYYDYSFIDADPKDHNDIFLAASPKMVVDEYIDALKELGLLPFIIEGESLAISRAIIEFGALKIRKPTLFIDIGDYKSTLIIYFGRAPRFTANLSFLFPARSSRKEQGINFDKDAEDGFFEELDKYLSFYEAHPLHEHLKNRLITKVILAGQRSDLTAYLSPIIARRMKIPVEISLVNNILRLSGIAQISTVSAGLALRII